MSSFRTWTLAVQFKQFWRSSLHFRWCTIYARPCHLVIFIGSLVHISDWRYTLNWQGMMMNLSHHVARRGKCEDMTHFQASRLWDFHAFVAWLSPLAKARKTTLISRAPMFRLGTGVGSRGKSRGFGTGMNQFVFWRFGIGIGIVACSQRSHMYEKETFPLSAGLPKKPQELGALNLSPPVAYKMPETCCSQRVCIALYTSL